MEYIETLKERFKELSDSFNRNRRTILAKYPHKEYEAIGQSSCYFYVKHEQVETEQFYEEAIDLLEEATLNQIRFIDAFLSMSAYNNLYDTKFISSKTLFGKIS